MSFCFLYLVLMSPQEGIISYILQNIAIHCKKSSYRVYKTVCAGSVWWEKHTLQSMCVICSELRV